MPDREHQHRIVALFKTVQRDVAASAPRNHQLAQIRFDAAPDQRMTAQHADRLPDQFNGFECSTWIIFDQKIGQPDQIVQGLRGVDQLRQHLARGFCAFFPAIRCFK